MKKLNFVFGGIIILGLFILSIPALAAEKFGYVNVDIVAKEYEKAKEYSQALEDKEASYNKEIEKKESEIKQLQDKWNLLSDKEKTEKQKEFEAKFKDYDEFVRQKQMDLRKEYIDKKIEIAKDIKEAVAQYAEKEGYTLVFDSMALIYQPKTLDITDKIVEIINKNYKSKR